MPAATGLSASQDFTKLTFASLQDATEILVHCMALMGFRSWGLYGFFVGAVELRGVSEGNKDRATVLLVPTPMLEFRDVVKKSWSRTLCQWIQEQMEFTVCD